MIDWASNSYGVDGLGALYRVTGVEFDHLGLISSLDSRGCAQTACLNHH